MENKELLPEMLAKAARAMRADAGYEGNGGLLDDCDYYARQAGTALLAADVPGLIAERDEARAALAALIGTVDVHETRSEDCDRSGEMYCNCLDRAVEQARRVLEKEATDGTN